MSVKSANLPSSIFRRIFFAAFLLAGWLGSAQASTCVVPYVFVPGPSISPTQVNSNFTAVTNCILTQVPQISSITSLKATATTTASVIVLVGRTTIGDITPIFYAASSAVCTLGSGAGDNASQVVSADGKCWLAVYTVANLVDDFGGDPTGVNDSTAALQNAVNAACNNPGAAGGATVFQIKGVYIPAGFYHVSGQIDVNNGCDISGGGAAIFNQNGGGTLLRMTNGCASGDLFRFHGWGAFSLRNLRMDTSTFANCNGGASYARVQAGGAGYAVNDTITLTGGTFTTATVLKVTAVSAGAVTGVVITTPGSYSVAPSAVAPVAQGSTSGGGTNATFNVVYATNAGVSISGPTTKLTADAAAGATTITVASTAGTGWKNGDSIAIEQDNGVYFTTTISGTPTATSITLAGGLTFKASANHPVYDTYATEPLISNVACAGFWDCVRIDNASYVTVEKLFAQNYLHDGVLKTSGANPDGGGDRYDLVAWDLNLGTSNAGIEVLAGGDMKINAGSKFLASNYSVLINSYFGPTGTFQLTGSSLEEFRLCAVKVHQSVSGVEYANVSVVGNEFTTATFTTGQLFCVDTGTPTSAPKWFRNGNFTANTYNGATASAVSLINIQDGDTIIVANNALNQNGNAGPTGFAVAATAQNVVEAGNLYTSFPTGAYGTVSTAALIPWRTSGALTVGGALTHNITLYGAGAGAYAKVSGDSTASGLLVIGPDNGSNAALRVVSSATTAQLSATDQTGGGSYKILGLNGSTISLLEGGASFAASDGSGNFTFNSALQVGSATLTRSAGELAFAKITASGVAPGAAGAKMEWVCGTGAGTMKLIAYAGTSAVATTIVDNVGGGGTGC